MPVPTATFWNIRRLNVIFAIASVAVLLSTLWLISADHYKPWRSYQDAGWAWEAAMFEARQHALQVEGIERDIARMQRDIDYLRSQLPNDRIAQLQTAIRELNTTIEQRRLKAAVEKGSIVPTQQKIEKAIIAHGEGHPTVAALRQDLRNTESSFNELNETIAAAKVQLEANEEALRELRESVRATQVAIDNLQLQQATLQEQLAFVQPQGISRVDNFIRDAPLAAWMNPKQRVQQTIVPGVRTELNFLTVDTIDRCQTCHVNIDNEDFELDNLNAFMARQLALAERLESVPDDATPIMTHQFWRNSAATLATQQPAAAQDMLKLHDDTRKALNILRTRAGLPQFAEGADINGELTALRTRLGDDKVDTGTWQRALGDYIAGVKQLLHKHLGDDGYKALEDLHRDTLTRRFNALRDQRGQPPLSTSRVLLAHPQLDRFVGDLSSHPKKTMACTVCHEGSGQEVLFEHTAHSPRDAWVDADTGAIVPAFLVSHQGNRREIDRWLSSPPTESKPAPESDPVQVVQVSTAGMAVPARTAAAASTVTPAASSGKDNESNRSVWTHDDVNLNNPHHGTPFAPEHHTAAAAAYVNPAEPGTYRRAVRQADRWAKEYGWHHVHYMHWEKPMHSMAYVESACAKCHTDVYDLEEAAPRLFAGRRLFAEMGCVNCHAVEGLKDDLDIRKVGPALTHIKEKLTPDMMSTWIWAPRSFRPTTRMPHYFMLENNSSPTDLLRTRVEVAAITHYLRNTPPSEGASAYEPQLPPDLAAVADLETRIADIRRLDEALKSAREKLTGIQREAGAVSDADSAAVMKRLDAQNAVVEKAQSALQALLPEGSDTKAAIAALEADVTTARTAEPTGNAMLGKAIFEQVGCMACHSNLDEQGPELIVNDLKRRMGLAEAEAKSKLEGMTYNQRHWYIQEHLEDQVMLVGPELSGVGSKLLAGRERKGDQYTRAAVNEARAWLYDWLRNPTHYSASTIMPSFRLSPEEADHLTAYLLSLRRPGTTDDAPYEPGDFAIRNDAQKAMLAELTAQLMGGQMTVSMARQEVAQATNPDNTPRWTQEAQLQFVGQKMVSHYGCNGCHAINGFETAASACTNLDDWGLKDPHKLDFGYFYAAYDKIRDQPLETWKVDHEGLGAEAPFIDATAAGVNGPVRPRQLEWEHIEGERRPWLYNKLHNSRIYDRGKFAYREAQGPIVTQKGKLGSEVDLGRIVSESKPYDKLKMPKFFLTDNEVQALVTYVTSIRKPLVDPSLQQVGSDGKQRATRGRQVAALYNCKACHDIEGNDVYIQRTITEAFQQNGLPNYEKVPPRLVGHGARMQPDWFIHFLHNVERVRPNLKIRMPSFPLSDHEATAFADYLNGWSQDAADTLGDIALTIDTGRAALQVEIDQLKAEQADLTKRKATPRPDDDPAYVDRRLAEIPGKIEALDRWYQTDRLREAAGKLHAWAVKHDLPVIVGISPDLRTAMDDKPDGWNKLLRAAAFLRDTYDIPHPYARQAVPPFDEVAYERGRQLYKLMNCALCHYMGDEDILIDLWKLANPKGLNPPTEEAGDPYGDAAEADPYGEADDDPYGEGSSDDTAAKGETLSPVLELPLIEQMYKPRAPNFSRVARKTQWDWFEKWVQEPTVIMPGTAMFQQFGGPVTTDPVPARTPAAFPFPQEKRDELHAQLGWLGSEQVDYLRHYLYWSSLRYHTPDAWKVTGAREPEPVALSPLPKPVLPQAEAAAADAQGKPEEATPPPPPTVVRAESDIALHDGEQAYEGEPVFDAATRVVGTVKFEGRPPLRQRINMAADAFCNSAHPDSPVRSEALVVTREGMMQNVLVRVVKGLPAGRTWTAPGPALLDQVGCVYIPHVLAVQAGQKLIVRNSDSTLHNVNMQSRNNGSANVGQPAKGMTRDFIFEQPELGIAFRCDVHPWMGANVHVVEHPFFAVSDIEGRFEIRGLPPGRYTLEAVHESGIGRDGIKPVTFEVEVKADTSVRSDVTLAP